MEKARITSKEVDTKEMEAVEDIAQQIVNGDPSISRDRAEDMARDIIETAKELGEWEE